MNYIFFAYQTVYDALNIDLALLGFSFSLWDFLLWSICASILVWFVGVMLFG